MFQQLAILRMAGALASHAGRRQEVIAENIAQADTPGYRARDLADFAAAYDSSEGGTSRLDDEPVPVPTAGSASPDGNSVSLESEMVRAADVKQQHDLALSVYRNMVGVLRTSLGRSS